MSLAQNLCLFASGFFLLTGLVTGVWKYIDMMKSENRRAHYYIDTCHRASLLYSFASLVILQFVILSPYSAAITLVCAAAPIAFFAFAITTYLVHGILKDTENQFESPYKLGKLNLPKFLFHGSMVVLIVAEIGGFGALFVGYLFSYVF
jgi:hypothetical protein